MSPHSDIWASAEEDSVGGWLHCSSAARTPQCCLWIQYYPLLGFPGAPRDYGFGWTCVSWAECHFVIYFCLFFFLKRDFERGSCISAIFELSRWSLTLFFLFFNELLSSYHCFFIWTYRTKAICSVTPFKVSAKPLGMDLDHVFVCDVTVGCSGNDYNMSQRKHFVFMHWADSRNILVLQNKTQRFFFVQMFSIIITNQGKGKIKKIAFKLYFHFLSMQILNYIIL